MAWLRTAAFAIALGCTPFVTGCVTDSGSLSASASKRNDPEQPKQECEHTEIAGATRTVCY